jgi:NADPH:quinone reductase-like Zn-dependent oxidoreductase
LHRLAGYVDEGSLKPIIARTFPLADARRAFESGTGPRRPGKTVLAVDGVAG